MTKFKIYLKDQYETYSGIANFIFKIILFTTIFYSGFVFKSYAGPISLQHLSEQANYSVKKSKSLFIQYDHVTGYDQVYTSLFNLNEVQLTFSSMDKRSPVWGSSGVDMKLYHHSGVDENCIDGDLVYYIGEKSGSSQIFFSCVENKFQSDQEISLEYQLTGVDGHSTYEVEEIYATTGNDVFYEEGNEIVPAYPLIFKSVYGQGYVLLHDSEVFDQKSEMLKWLIKVFRYYFDNPEAQDPGYGGEIDCKDCSPSEVDDVDTQNDNESNNENTNQNQNNNDIDSENTNENSNQNDTNSTSSVDADQNSTIEVTTDDDVTINTEDDVTINIDIYVENSSQDGDQTNTYSEQGLEDADSGQTTLTDADLNDVPQNQVLGQMSGGAGCSLNVGHTIQFNPLLLFIMFLPFLYIRFGKKWRKS